MKIRRIYNFIYWLVPILCIILISNRGSENPSQQYYTGYLSWSLFDILRVRISEVMTLHRISVILLIQINSHNLNSLYFYWNRTVRISEGVLYLWYTATSSILDQGCVIRRYFLMINNQKLTWWYLYVLSYMMGSILAQGWNFGVHVDPTSSKYV